MTTATIVKALTGMSNAETNKELLARLNMIHGATNRAPLKGWKASKQKLIDRLAAERTEAVDEILAKDDDLVDAVIAAPTGTPKPGSMAAEMMASLGKTSTTPTRSTRSHKQRVTNPGQERAYVAAVCREGFASDYTNDEIHQNLMNLVKDDNVSITYSDDRKWYIQWYRTALARKAAKDAAKRG